MYIQESERYLTWMFSHIFIHCNLGLILVAIGYFTFVVVSDKLYSYTVDSSVILSI